MKKSTLQLNVRVSQIEKLLKKSFIFKNYFTGFTSIPEGRLPRKFTMLDVKFYGTEHPHYNVRNFLSIMTIKGMGDDIIHIILPWTSNNDVMRSYNTIDPHKVTSWDDLRKEFLHLKKKSLDKWSCPKKEKRKKAEDFKRKKDKLRKKLLLSHAHLGIA